MAKMVKGSSPTGAKGASDLLTKDYDLRLMVGILPLRLESEC